MPITGNFVALANLRTAVDEAERGALRPELAKVLGAAAIKLVADEFRSSEDPYGRPWKPLARERARNVRASRRRRARGLESRGGSKPLINTGRLKNAFNPQSVDTSPDGFTINIPVDYASYHQFGTSRIPQRQMLPMAATGGLGPIWTRAFQEEADKLIRRRFGG